MRVMVRCDVSMAPAVPVVMVVRIEQQPGAPEIHDEPNHRDDNGLIEADRHRSKDARDNS